MPFMMASLSLLVCSFLLLSITNVISATTEDSEIVEELKTFIRDQVEPNIERYLQSKRKTKDHSLIGEDCLEHKAGRLLRHRCCVVYSNLAAAMIFGTYGTARSSDNDGSKPEHADLQTLRDYHSTRQRDYHPQELDILFKIWALNNPQRNGIYTFPLLIAGVPLLASKCEFSHVHTFLALERQDDTTRQPVIVVDMSWKQIFLMVIADEQLSDERKETVSEQLSIQLKDEDDFWVFPQDQPPSLLMSNDAMKVILQQGTTAVLDDSTFNQQHILLLRMYSDNFSRMMCGKTTADIEKEQQQLAQQQRQILSQQQQEL